MKNLSDVIARLRLSFQSLEQEASGELEGDRSEGIQAIADSVAAVIGTLEDMEKKPVKGRWTKIANDKVRHVWTCKDPHCPEVKKPFYVNPDWYQDNGTPTCECGEDMTYVRTEALKG